MMLKEGCDALDVWFAAVELCEKAGLPFEVKRKLVGNLLAALKVGDEAVNEVIRAIDAACADGRLNRLEEALECEVRGNHESLLASLLRRVVALEAKGSA